MQYTHPVTEAFTDRQQDTRLLRTLHSEPHFQRSMYLQAEPRSQPPRSTFSHEARFAYYLEPKNHNLHNRCAGQSNETILVLRISVS
jgi:hypothetical protein